MRYPLDISDIGFPNGRIGTLSRARFVEYGFRKIVLDITPPAYSVLTYQVQQSGSDSNAGGFNSSRGGIDYTYGLNQQVFNRTDVALAFVSAPAAPTCAANASGGLDIPGNTYYIRTTWFNSVSGAESLPSPEVSFTTTTASFTISPSEAPSAAPFAADSFRVYISTSTDTEKLIGSASWSPNGTRNGFIYGGGAISSPVTVPTTKTLCGITSPAQPFNSLDAGNVLRITGVAAWVAGFYEIVYQNGGTVVLALPPTAGTANLSGGIAVLGGSLASIGMAGQALLPGNVLCIEAGPAPYLISNSATNASNGPFSLTAAAPANAPETKIIGHGKTRLDFTSRPLFTVSSSLAVTIISCVTDFCRVANLSFQENGSVNPTICIQISGNGSTIIDCDSNTYGNVQFYATGTNSVIERCVGLLPTLTPGVTIQHCIRALGTGNTVVQCQSNSSILAYTNSISFCVAKILSGAFFEGCVATAFNATGSGRNTARNCIAYSSPTLGGFSLSTGTGMLSLRRCAIVGQSYIGYPGQPIERDNCLIVSADPFINASVGDFRLNNDPNGGARLRGAGSPQNIPGLIQGFSYRDIGVYQHPDPARPGSPAIRTSVTTTYFPS